MDIERTSQMELDDKLAVEEQKPNIVFILVDNVGWGGFGAYGGTTSTPRIDKMASEGIRCNNYNVEVQCTPTRSAIMTGRHPVRSGTTSVPFPGRGSMGLRPGNTPSPSFFPTRAMQPRCTASGIWAASTAGFQTTRASTSGGVLRTALTRQAIRHGHCSRRAVCLCLCSGKVRKVNR